MLRRYDTSALRVIVLQRRRAARRPGATRRSTRFGDCVYNIYGSTEVALATIAGPRDLRAAPGTRRPTPDARR